MISLRKASEFAVTAHASQVDKAGNPYHFHLLAVRDALAIYGEDVQIAGVLHDVIEDTQFKADDLRRMGVPEHIIAAINSVTRRSGETYMEMIARAAAHPIGRLVKLADNRHNSDETRLALLPPDDAARLRVRYSKARAVLEAACD